MRRERNTAVGVVALLSLFGLLGGCATSPPSTSGAATQNESETTSEAAVPVAAANNLETKKELEPYEKAVKTATDPLSPTRLILVSRYGEDKTVKYLLDSNVDVNGRDRVGGTALIAASEGGHLDVVKRLLSAKADVNAATPQGETALMAAASNGNNTVVRLLLDAGADIQAKNKSGETALFNAVRYGHSDVARMLLNAGMDPNLQNSDRISATTSGYTPLMYAAAQGVGTVSGDWADMVSLLIEKGARLNTRSVRGETALSIAQRRADSEIIAILEKAGARQETAYTSLSEEAALVKSARSGDLDKVRALLESGTKPNTNLDNGLNPLLAACFDNQYEVVELLLKHGADVNIVPIGLRQYALAASATSTKDQQLIKSASRGDTALLVSIRGGYEKLVDLLLAKGADPTRNNSQGEAPLFVAAATGNAAIVKALLAKGVDPNTLETEKLTVSMTNTLLSMGRNTPLITAAQAGHIDVIKALLQGGADANYQGFLGKTALFWAAERGYAPIVDLLLETKADPNLNSVEGLTPLMMAARLGSERIVAALLKYEADPNKTEIADIPGSGGKAFGNTGMTALIYAARGGHDNIVKMLIEAGSNLNAMSRSGETAIREANSNGHQSIVNLLKVSGAQEF